MFSPRPETMQAQIILLSATLLGAVNSLFSGFGDQTAKFGGEAHYGCAVNDLPGALQVTWQRMLKDESIENLATYSKRFGQQVNEPYQEKIVFTEASLSSTAITVKNVTWGDESCYICSFNVYPDGSRRRQTCLTVKGISEVTTAVLISAKENGAEVTFSCSATGKPPPTIQWDLLTSDLHSSHSQTTTVSTSDSTFTSRRNVSLQVPSDWNGYVDCVVNSGMVGERRERIPLSLDPGKKKKDEAGKAFLALHFALPITVMCVSCCILGAAATFWKRVKRDSRPEVIL